MANGEEDNCLLKADRSTIEEFLVLAREGSDGRIGGKFEANFKMKKS